MLGWLLVAGWAIVTIMAFTVPDFAAFAGTAQLALMLLFVGWHGTARYGAKGMATFAIAVIVIVNIFETASIATGFPFGFYEHQAAMGPKLGLVPIIIGPIYFVNGYVAWTLGNILLGEPDRDRGHGSLVALAIAAALIVTGWDAVVDPPGATALHSWIYRHGGGYYGVPLSNFGGWLLTTSIAFFVAGWLMRRFGTPPRTRQPLDWWLQPAALFAIQPLPAVLGLLLIPGRSETDAAGNVWNTAHIYEGTTVVGIVTCLAFGVIAGLAAMRQHGRA